MDEPRRRPDYLVIGHLTQDLQPDGTVTPGGTAAYSALTAAALGRRVALVTSLAPAADLGPLIDVDREVVAAERSSTFVNLYGPEGRSQRLLSRAVPLELEAVPRRWLEAKVVHLGPVADEVSPAIARAAAEAGAGCIGVTPQGWMRSWDDQGRIGRKRWSWYQALAGVVDAVVFSEEDVERDLGAIERLAGCFPVTSVTRGARGARLWIGGEGPRVIEAPPRAEVDPTGAGDIFAAVFFALLSDGLGAVAATRAACELAAASVTGRGLDGIPGAAAAAGVTRAVQTNAVDRHRRGTVGSCNSKKE